MKNFLLVILRVGDMPLMYTMSAKEESEVNKWADRHIIESGKAHFKGYEVIEITNDLFTKIPKVLEGNWTGAGCINE